MKKLDNLSKKLQTLQAEKQKIQSKIAEKLYAETQKVLGEDFSLSLALTLIQQGWNHSEKSKEEWLNLAASFQGSQNRKMADKSEQVKRTHYRNPTESLPLEQRI